MSKSRKTSRRKEVEIVDVTFRSPHGELSETEKTYVRRKLARLARFFHKIWTLEFVHESVRGQHEVAINVDADGHTFHIQERHAEFRGAVDAAVQSLEHQLARYKEKLQKGRGRLPREALLAEAVSLESTEPAETENPSTPTVRSVRRVTLKPMSVEEALLQAEMDERPFYVFHDADTDRVCVLTRQGDGVYDLIEIT